MKPSAHDGPVLKASPDISGRYFGVFLYTLPDSVQDEARCARLETAIKLLTARFLSFSLGRRKQEVVPSLEKNPLWQSLGFLRHPLFRLLPEWRPSDSGAHGTQPRQMSVPTVEVCSATQALPVLIAGKSSIKCPFCPPDRRPGFGPRYCLINAPWIELANELKLCFQKPEDPTRIFSLRLQGCVRSGGLYFFQRIDQGVDLRPSNGRCPQCNSAQTKIYVVPMAALLLKCESCGLFSNLERYVDY